MPQLIDNGLEFDAEELAWFTEYFGTTEWAVYVSSMDEIHAFQNPDLDDDDPENPPHTEESAHAAADWINTKLAPRDELDPVMRAVVLHYGVPVETAPVAEETAR